MKKILYLIPLFLFVVIPHNVSALSFTATDGNKYDVTDVETLRDYCYYTYIKNKNYSYLTVDVSSGYTCSVFNLPDGYNAYFEYNNYGKITNSSLSNGVSKYRGDSIGRFYYYDTNFKSGNSSYIGGPSFRGSGYANLDFYNNISFAELVFSKNFDFQDIEDKYSLVLPKYTISYYLNNVLYNSFEVEKGSSHNLIDNPDFDSSIQKFSGWTYDNNINLNNITSDVSINGTISDKSFFTVSYFVDDNLYKTFNVIEGSSIELEEYDVPQFYTFSGWTYDNNINLNNISSNVVINGYTTKNITFFVNYYLNGKLYKSFEVEKGSSIELEEYDVPKNYIFSGWNYNGNDLNNVISDIDIYGVTTYVFPSADDSGSYNSVIHNLSVSILGDNIPSEFEFVYIFMDFIILILLVVCVISPFILIKKIFFI